MNATTPSKNDSNGQQTDSEIAETQPEQSAKKLAYCIDIVGLSKSFRRQTVQGGYTTLKSAVLEMFRDPFGRRQKPAFSKTLAVKDLTLRILPGQAVGIIGRNGSGKSTLLKLVTGIYRPDAGKISINGRLAALIELGAGFHPDFSGRENVFLSGAMFGMSKQEIEERFEDIVAFAELQDVIDDPVRTYSSGMYMRLGFSVAVHTNPDVLLIDEVLAVGDATFSVKCRDKLSELKKNGKTFLLVSHDLGSVERWCDEAVWLHEGSVKDRGDPRRVIDHYREFIERGEEIELEKLALAQVHELKLPPQDDKEQQESNDGSNSLDESNKDQKKRWGSKEIEITSIRLKNAKGEDHLVFHPDEALNLEIGYVVNDLEHVTSESTVFGIGIHRLDGLVIHGSNTDIERVKMPNLGSAGTVRYQIPRIGLLDGQYRLDLAVHRQDGYPFDYHQAAIRFSIRSSVPQIGVYVPPHSWSIDANA